MKEKEIKLLDITMFASIVFIFTIMVSILLTYNEKLILLGEKPIFDKDNEKKIANIYRFILLGVAITYVYVAYQEYKINQIKGNKNDTKSSFVGLLVRATQLLTVIVIILLPFIYPDEDELEETNIIIS